MINKIYLRFLLSLTLVVSIFAVSLPPVGYAQTSAQTQSSNDLARQLQTIEEKVEARRRELGIPGMSLAIVSDDRIIYAKGLGYKDFEKQVPVTADTQFAIGSATKAFTALSVLMTQDEGKLSLDDSPKKYLPYFKMKDAETDARITVRDLLSHSSGLNRTDLAMITGKLNRAELIQVAGEAKPTARLREKFQYQNIMFAAAGEIVAQTQGKAWEKFIPERIFKPLGMTNSTMSMVEMQKVKDYSFGYDYNFDTKETRRLPFREIDQVAPAGSINSSAKDMAQWLRFVLNGGSAGGKRLVSEKGFEEWLKPQMKISPNGKFNYSLGWFLQEWNGLKVVQHGGNIDGFNALVAMIPEKKLGFVMLTNVSGSPLGNELMPIVWENILGKPNATTSAAGTVAPEKEVGKYKFEAAGLDLEVKMENGKLVAVVPGQPTYVLENVGGRKYKLTNAPEGFFITFREKDAYLEQPQGNYTLPRAVAEIINAAPNPADNPAKELIGKYETPSGKSAIEVREADGKVSLVVPGQPPYELRVKDKDVFSSPLLPDAYSVKVTRDAGGKLSGIVLVQPEGEFSFKYAGAGEKPNAPKMSLDEVMTKAVNALGGEANWRKISSRETKYDIDFEHQGVKGTVTSYQKAPNLFASDTTFTALGKPIATAYEYFDGTRGGDVTSFSPADTLTGQRLEDVKVENDFYGLLNWKSGLKSAEVARIDKLGDEEVYVVVIRPEKASEYTYFISTKTFLPLKKSGVIVSSTSSVKLPMSQTFSDYRAVDGVMIPYKTVTSTPTMGDVVSYVREVKHNVSIDDAKFKPKAEIDGKVKAKNK
ncbi:MAG TPA: serine hydrolase [Pyrinomonadaceae bacterium]|jgi:CubicO group peptidase (beta-lactamase class C family)